MALAGAGNPVGGSNPAGISLGLNYIGDFAYGYSGTFEATTSDQVVFEFTTGNSLFKGTLFATGTVNFTSGGLTNGRFTGWKISFDNQVIAFLKTDSAQEDNPNEVTMPLLIPPFTLVKVEIVSSADSSADLITTSLAGRVYA